MHACRHIQMHVCMYTHMYTCKHTIWQRTQSIYSKFPQNGDKMTKSTRNLLLEGTVLMVGFDFFLSCVQAALAHCHPPCPSITEVAVGPFLSHSNCWWGSHMCLQKSSDTPKLRGPRWAFKGPCGLGQVTALPLPVWKWGGQATNIYWSFLLWPLSNPMAGDPTVLHSDRMEVGLSSHQLLPLQGYASCSLQWLA